MAGLLGRKPDKQVAKRIARGKSTREQVERKTSDYEDNPIARQCRKKIEAVDDCRGGKYKKSLSSGTSPTAFGLTKWLLNQKSDRSL
ncbi:unnamed protein product [Toxocara canis]|uniref:Transposase n=1 Tax=Toxocara canis TaxID=6265 RepID=A0A183VGG5_TOXCA|nr:unnamed protein product [Toxocara canis]